jgi:hypothetical protein
MVAERKEDREATGRRASSETLDGENNEIPIFNRTDEIGCWGYLLISR